MCSELLKIIFYYQRRLVKWVLRWITGSCELLRIVNSKDSVVKKTKNIEKSLTQSRNSVLNDFYSNIKKSGVESFARQIVKIKHIQKPHDFQTSICPLLTRIYNYKELMERVEEERTTTYSSLNQQHESTLLQLWHNLKPTTPLTARRCKLWQEIGFQGDDPATDFRGMGLLGLNCLHHLSSAHSSISRNLLLHSAHPGYGYFFAVVGINITSLAYNLLSDGALKECFYVSEVAYGIGRFYEVYVYLFVEFDKYWIACRPASIMEFEERKRAFEGEMVKKLREGSFMGQVVEG